MLTDALDRLPRGVLLLDTRLAVKFANTYAEEVLAAGDGLRLDRDGLQAARPADSATLRAHRPGAAHPAACGPRAAGGYLAVRRPSLRRPLELLVTPLTPELATVAPGRAVAAVFLVDPDRRLELPHEALASSTASPGRSACPASLLAEGVGLPEAAAQLGITRETAKSTLHTIFARTDARPGRARPPPAHRSGSLHESPPLPPNGGCRPRTSAVSIPAVPEEEHERMSPCRFSSGFDSMDPKRCLRAALVVAALTGVTGAGAQVEAWRTRSNRGIDGEAYLGDTDHRRNEQSLVVDLSGNTFVADSVHDGSSWDFLVAKYGPDGALIWSTRVDSPSVGAQQDWPTALALDSFGNVFVTGYSSGNPGGTDLLTAKVNSLGLQQWAVLHNGVGNPEEWGRAIAVDSAGSVFVAGERNSNANDFLIVKHRPGGALQWSATFDGATHGDERLFGLAVDGNGSPYVTGWSRDAVSGVSDFMTVRWSAAGSQHWAVPFDNPAPGTQEDWAYGLTLDVAGNAYVVGESNNQFMTVKYDSAGVQQWRLHSAECLRAKPTP